jgi:hypothetical protein
MTRRVAPLATDGEPASKRDGSNRWFTLTEAHGLLARREGVRSPTAMDAEPEGGSWEPPLATPRVHPVPPHRRISLRQLASALADASPEVCIRRRWRAFVPGV